MRGLRNRSRGNRLASTSHDSDGGMRMWERALFIAIPLVALSLVISKLSFFDLPLSATWQWVPALGVVFVLRRWPVGAHAAHDHRRGQRGVCVRRRLPRRPSPAAPALHPAVPVHGGHDRLRHSRQPDRAVPVLGNDQPHLVHAGGLQPRATRQPQIGAASAAGHGHWRSGAAGRLHRAGSGHGQLVR